MSRKLEDCLDVQSYFIAVTSTEILHGSYFGSILLMHRVINNDGVIIAIQDIQDRKSENSKRTKKFPTSYGKY